MSKWATPELFISDGCTWPTGLNDLLGRDRNKQGCRRHDFECRYGLNDWDDSRDYLMDYIKENNPWYLLWFRWPLIWLGLTVFNKACRDYEEPIPPEWTAWVDREYEQ